MDCECECVREGGVHALEWLGKRDAVLVHGVAQWDNSTNHHCTPRP